MQQNTLIAGDTLNFATAVADYLASAGWTLKYRLVPRTGANPAITFDSTAEGDDHRVQIAATTTAGWAADSYTWNSWVDKAGEVYSVDNGQIIIAPDPRTVAAGYDGRSPARQALDAADAALRTYGAKAYLQSYDIAGRGQRFQSPGDFMAWRQRLQQEVAAEQRAANIAAGQPDRRKILVRVPRA